MTVAGVVAGWEFVCAGGNALEASALHLPLGQVPPHWVEVGGEQWWVACVGGGSAGPGVVSGRGG